MDLDLYTENFGLAILEALRSKIAIDGRNLLWIQLTYLAFPKSGHIFSLSEIGPFEDPC